MLDMSIHLLYFQHIIWYWNITVLCDWWLLQNKLGSGIPVWSDLTISDGLKYISGSYKIAMVYSGDSAPMLVLENKHSYSWDICISASEVSSGVAFYSYDDIAQAFSNYGVSIYDMGQLHIFTSNYTEIYEVYASPVWYYNIITIQVK